MLRLGGSSWSMIKTAFQGLSGTGYGRDRGRLIYSTQRLRGESSDGLPECVTRQQHGALPLPACRCNSVVFYFCICLLFMRN